MVEFILPFQVSCADDTVIPQHTGVLEKLMAFGGQLRHKELESRDVFWLLTLYGIDYSKVHNIETQDLHIDRYILIQGTIRRC